MNIFNSFSTILQTKPDPFNKSNSISKYFNLDVSGGYVNVLNSIRGYSPAAYSLNTNCDFSNNTTPTTYLIYKNKANNRVLRTTDYSSNSSFTIYLKHACRFSSTPVFGHNFVTDLIPLGGVIVPLNYYTVTVMNNVFWMSISGESVSNPVINFSVGNLYIFDQSDPSNSENTLVFGNVPDSSMNYTTAVAINGTAGNPGSYTLINYTTYNVFLYYYSNNLSGMGAACGTKVLLTATQTSQSVQYTGSPITFTPVTNGTYSGNASITQSNIGTYTTTITGTGRYYGSVTASLVIQPIPLTATVTSQTLSYTGTPITFTLSVNGTYSGSPSITQTNVGTYTTTITGTGVYSGSVTASLVIQPIPLTATVTSQTLSYTGSPISATLITNINGTYSGSPSITQTSSGTYTTTITGTGGYYGSFTGTLVILNNVPILLSGGTVPLSNASNLYFAQNIYNYLQGKTLHMKFNLNGVEQDINIINAQVGNDVFQIRIVRSKGYNLLTILYGGFGTTNSFSNFANFNQSGHFPIRSPHGDYAVIMDNFNYSSNYHLFFYFTNQNTTDGQYYPRIYVYNSNGTLITNNWKTVAIEFTTENSNPAFNLNLYGQSGYNVTYNQPFNQGNITFPTVWVLTDSYGTFWNKYTSIYGTFTGLIELPYQLFNNSTTGLQYTLSILEYYPNILTPALMSSYST